MYVEPPVSMFSDRSAGFDGIFSTILNVAGSFVGDPALGSQVAGQASPAYANITETPQEIAARVAPDVITDIGTPNLDLKTVTPQAQSVAQATAQAIALEMGKQGYVFPAGTLGATYQKPSLLDAFGGNHENLIKSAAVILGGALLLKVL